MTDLKDYIKKMISDLQPRVVTETTTETGYAGIRLTTYSDGVYHVWSTRDGWGEYYYSFGAALAGVPALAAELIRHDGF